MNKNENNKTTSHVKVSVWPPITSAVIIFAAGFFVGHAIPNYGYTLPFFNSLQSKNETPPTIPTPTTSLSACKRVTYATNSMSPIKDRFFPTYTAKRGDTLFSVARTQLGDVSRVNELINLNKNQYPYLSITSPSLEAGIKLYITPKNFPANSGDLYIAEGIVDQNDGGILLLKNSPSSYVGDFQINLTSTTKYMNGITSVKRGDCISMIVDFMGNDSHKALVIWSQ